MKFTKMHGLGNDYVYVNCFEEKIGNINEVAKYVSDRHFGIGSDGLILICPSKVADFQMKMYNLDGSEGKMCGNGIRCVGKYVYDNKMTSKKVITVETLAGIKTLNMTVKDNKVELIRVDMGEPILNGRDIPIKSDLKEFVSQPVKVNDNTYKVTCVSMGNPHAVTYVDDVDNFPLEIDGKTMETLWLFPDKVNAEFVEVINRETLKMRVWERGSNETWACGTGACAVLVSSVLNDISERKATIKLLGGDLIIEWNEDDNHVYMTGPATTVFTGEIDIK